MTFIMYSHHLYRVPNSWPSSPPRQSFLPFSLPRLLANSLFSVSIWIYLSGLFPINRNHPIHAICVWLISPNMMF